MTGQILCHCVSSDCSRCPMRHTGTSGVRAETINPYVRRKITRVDATPPAGYVTVEWKEKDGFVYCEGKRK